VENEQTVVWAGASGREYTYWVFAVGTPFNVAPGNYVFAKATKLGAYSPIYVGETDDLSTRFGGHHKESCIEREGATHIHVHRSSENEKVRQAEEADIVAKWNPPCNG
jgi:hypothetical protein